MTAGAAPRLQYLDALRGIAVTAMVLAHVSDSWTLDAARRSEAWYTVAFIGGVASPLFLFLAGVATAMSASSKARRAQVNGEPPAAAHITGARMARRRGWQIFGLGLLFRVQSQVLGMGPAENLFKVDILNVMGLTVVAASYLWQLGHTQKARLATFAIATGAVAMVTPIVRDVAWLGVLPDPVEAYLRPEGHYAAFPMFPWSGFLLAGALAGELVDRFRGMDSAREPWLQTGFILAGGAGVVLGWWASFLPAIYDSSSFWHDSPTFFFIRLGLVVLLVATARVLEYLMPPRAFAPIVTLGRSSLFVYWVHVEIVYGVLADPIKRSLPLWMSLLATALLTVALYGAVLVKNQYLPRLKRIMTVGSTPASVRG